MQRCILCGRKISNNKYNFGLSCLKRMCNIVGIDNVKNLNSEVVLDKRVLKLANKKSLLKTQRQLLTDRYLTLQLLNEVSLPEYDKYRYLVRKDIESINRSTRSVPSSNVITLKQASEVNKIYKTYKSTFQKIIDGDYDIIQNITFEIVRFAFSRYYNNKPYLSDMNQILQHHILKAGVIGLRGSNNNFAADCLEHSLQENPKDIIVTEGKVIDDIQNDINFKKAIKNIFNEKNTTIIKSKENLNFVNGDLFYALHGTTMNVEGKKNKNNKWDLQIEITDRYDFTDLREIEQYIVNDNSYATGIIGAFANNLGMIATSCKVIHEYNITIKFSIKDWEV